MESQRTSTGRDQHDPPVTVLLVDDDCDLRESFWHWLSETTNWRIRQAADGREALGKLDETVDVVVLDRDMPHLSGDEVVQRLPQTTFAGQVVVLSASDPDASLNGEFVDSYLHKPLSPQALVAHLESVV